jgi:hypothetical protein
MSPVADMVPTFAERAAARHAPCTKANCPHRSGQFGQHKGTPFTF